MSAAKAAPQSNAPATPPPQSEWISRARDCTGSKLLAAAIEQMSLLDVRDGAVVLTGPREVMMAAQHRRTELSSSFFAATGLQLKVELIVPDAVTPAPTEVQPAKTSMQEHPLVRQAISELGAVFVREAPRAKPHPQN